MIVAGAAWLAVFFVCSLLLVLVTVVVAVCGLLCWTMSDVSVATDVACGSVSQVDRHVIVDDVAFGAAPGVATDNRKGCNHMLMFAVILATCCDHNLSARRLSLMGLCFACVCVACHPAGCAGNRSGFSHSVSLRVAHQCRDSSLWRAVSRLSRVSLPQRSMPSASSQRAVYAALRRLMLQVWRLELSPMTRCLFFL